MFDCIYILLVSTLLMPLFCYLLRFINLYIEETKAGANETQKATKKYEYRDDEATNFRKNKRDKKKRQVKSRRKKRKKKNKKLYFSVFFVVFLLVCSLLYYNYNHYFI